MSTDSLLNYALEYAKRGWYVFPLQPNSKIPFGKTTGLNDASLDEEVIRSWWADHPNANIGVNCGLSGLVVLDVDTKDDKVGGQSLMDIIGDEFELLDTVMSMTWSGGRHYFYRGKSPSSNSQLGVDLDIKADGGYVVAAPSVIAENGKTGRYSWITTGEKQEIRDFPDRFRPTARKRLEITEELTIITGGRNDTLTKIAGTLRRAGLSSEEMYAALQATNRKRCRPPLPDEELVRIAESVARYALPKSAPLAVHHQKTALQVVRASSVTEEEHEWLWPGRIPMGLMTAIVGPEDVGKTYFYVALAAALSRGATLPQADGPFQCESLLFHGEDLKVTIRERLKTCGADLGKIHLIDQEIDNNAIAAIDDYLRLNPAIKLLVIDPISSILGTASDNNDTEVRNALAPLHAVTERHGIVTLYLRHTGKDPTRTALAKVLGAKAFTAVPRTVLYLDEHKVTRRRALFNIKNNLSEKADPIEYFIDGEGFHFGGIDESLDHDDFARSQPDAEKPKSRVKAEDVVAWLRQVLEDGPMPAPMLFQQARSNGLSEKALRRNKETAGATTEKFGGTGGGWFWSIKPILVPGVTVVAKDATQDGRSANVQLPGTFKDGQYDSKAVFKERQSSIYVESHVRNGHVTNDSARGVLSDEFPPLTTYNDPRESVMGYVEHVFNGAA